MTIKWLALPVMAMAACVIGSSPSTAHAAPRQAPAYVGDQGGWDAPPAEFREVKRQGFHDGIEGARKDFDHHRPPNVNGRAEYRHPHVDASVRDDYREGYRRGYEVAMQHLQGGQPGQ
jgi:hypothetical protein